MSVVLLAKGRVDVWFSLKLSQDDDSEEQIHTEESELEVVNDNVDIVGRACHWVKVSVPHLDPYESVIAELSTH